MRTNCKNCGAPLHNGRCDYCGTEYETPMPTHRINFNVVHAKTETLSCVTSVPLYILRNGNEAEVADVVKHEAARKMAEELVKYMDVETWLKPETLEQMFGCRVKVVDERWR